VLVDLQDRDTREALAGLVVHHMAEVVEAVPAKLEAQEQE
jgi:hypothetical protein